MTFVVTLSEAFQFVFAAFILLIVVFLVLRRAWRQWRCPHTGSYGETSACQAVCHDCGKELGFIGAERERRHRMRESNSPTV